MRALNKRRYLLLAVPALIALATALVWLRPIGLSSLFSTSTQTDSGVAVGSAPGGGRASLTVAAQPAAGTTGGSIPVASPPARGTTGVRMATVRRGTIRDTLRLFGRVVPQEEIAIVAPTDGKIANLSVQTGATVSSGQLVAKLDPDVPVLGLAVPADPAGLMRAPWSGAITDVQLHVGDRAQTGQTVVVLARQANPLLQLELTEQDAARIALGQRVTALDPSTSPSAPERELAGLVVDLATAKDGKSSVGMVELEWAGGPPEFGTVVDLQVVVQQKTDALLVPARAVHSLGDRHFVEYMDAGLRKTANVELGIVSGDDVEIRQGLTEGQQVIAL